MYKVKIKEVLGNNQAHLVLACTNILEAESRLSKPCRLSEIIMASISEAVSHWLLVLATGQPFQYSNPLLQITRNNENNLHFSPKILCCVTPH